MPTAITLRNIPEGYQSIISNGRHSIVGDEPISGHGTDLGMSPTELVLSGLALCKVATVRYAVRKAGLEDKVQDIIAHMSQDVKRGEGRNLLTSVQVKIEIHGDLDAETKQELVKKADRCYVHRMLDGDWDIEDAELIRPPNNHSSLNHKEE